MDDIFYKIYSDKAKEIQPTLTRREVDWNILSSRLPPGKRNWFIYLCWCGVCISSIVFLYLFISGNKISFLRTKGVVVATKLSTTDDTLMTIAMVKDNILKPTRSNFRTSNKYYEGVQKNTNSVLLNSEIKDSKKSLLFKTLLHDDIDRSINYTAPDSIYNSKYQKDGHIVNIEDKQVNLVHDEPNYQDQSHIFTSDLSPRISDHRIKIIPLKNIPELNLSIISNKVNNPMQNTPFFTVRNFGSLFIENGNPNYPNIKSNHIQESLLSSKGFQLGLAAYFHKSKSWRFGIGIMMEQNKFEVEHINTIQPNQLKFIATDAENRRQFSYSYTVAYDNLISEVDISLFEVAQNQNLEKDEEFKLKMNIGRIVNTLQIPFSIEYKIASFGKLNVFATGGSNLTVSRKINNELYHHSETCEELCFVNNFKPRVYSKAVDKISVNGRIGLSLEMNINKKFAIGASSELILRPNSLKLPWIHQQTLGVYLSQTLN